jgi:hypothetical protein
MALSPQISGGTAACQSICTTKTNDQRLCVTILGGGEHDRGDHTQSLAQLGAIPSVLTEDRGERPLADLGDGAADLGDSAADLGDGADQEFADRS